MKRFRFTLEQVLNLRKHEEREWELKLAAATAECVKIMNRINEKQMEKRKTLKDDFSRDFVLMRSRCLYLSRLEQQTAELERLLKGREEEREKIRKIYIEHAKRRKVLEKLREHREAEHRKAVRKEETKRLDEISSSAFVRKRNNQSTEVM